MTFGCLSRTVERTKVRRFDLCPFVKIGPDVPTAGKVIKREKKRPSKLSGTVFLRQGYFPGSYLQYPLGCKGNPISEMAEPPASFYWPPRFRSNRSPWSPPRHPHRR